MPAIVPAHVALERLRAGNARYTANLVSVDALASHMRRDGVPIAAPIAIILGCSDARAPAEIVFNQGLGDLFIVRVAGNVIAPSGVGSVEFAAERYNTRLVVVMGHSHCAAVGATLEAATGPSPSSPNQLSIVERIRPAVAPLLGTELARDPARLYREAIRANVRMSANHLRHGSAVIERLIAEDGLVVVGAELDLESGAVDFFDGVPPS